MKAYRWIVVPFVALMGSCSSDDAPMPGRYAGVSRWECHGDTTSCYCAGLEPDSIYMSSKPQMAACAGFTCCFSYLETTANYCYGDCASWGCSCANPAGECSPQPSWSQVKSEAQCPPR
ncbi:MAG: hypothetical protein HY898_00545 [Deltaproteobacteria bacterium]|nr:hypothetical protein [Deltaproteobacteria bacterium]